MTNRVVVIGAGAIGSAVTRRLLAAGREVSVWNRTPGRTAALAEAGARVLDDLTPDGPLLLLALTDHTAVRQCLDALGSDLSGRTVVALCTGTPDDARRAADQVARLGGHYLDAGLQTGPDLTGMILYSGDRAVFRRHEATLAELGTPRFAGEAPEAAAVWDLALFGIWYDAQLGLLRAFDTVRAGGIDVTEFAATAGGQLAHVVSAVDATAGEVVRGDYPPGPADLAEHRTVLDQLCELRRGRPLGDGGLAEVSARITALLAAGSRGQGLTATIG